MRACFDTNVFLRIFSRAPAFLKIQRSLINGRLALAISNEMLLEYEEVVAERSRHASWQHFESFLVTLEALGSVVRVSPSYRFGVIAEDHDDDKFCDCAIAGEADFVVRYDRHFDVLRGSGYKPQPITPEE